MEASESDQLALFSARKSGSRWYFRGNLRSAYEMADASARARRAREALSLFCPYDHFVAAHNKSRSRNDVEGPQSKAVCSR